MAKRLAIFIDEGEASFQARQRGRRLDYRALCECLTQELGSDEDHLSQTVVYLGMPPVGPRWERARRGREKFLHWLRSEGYFVREVPSRDYGDYYKAEVMVPLSIEAVDFVREAKPDVVALVATSPSVPFLCDRLRAMGVTVAICGERATTEFGVLEAGNQFVDLSTVYGLGDVWEAHNGESAGGVGAVGGD